MTSQLWQIIGIFSIVVNLGLLILLFYDQSNAEEVLSDQRLSKLENIEDYHVIVDAQNVVSALHALKMPVGAVEGILQFMQRHQSENLNARQKEHLSLALGTIERISYQLSDYSDALDLKSKKLEVSLECVSIYNMISQVLRAFDQAMKQQQISLGFYLAEEHFYADAHKMKQVLYNLMEIIIPNLQGGSIDIKSSVTDQWFNLDLQIKGEGLIGETGDKLYSLFKEDEGDLTANRSLLSIILSKKLIGRMGGKLRVLRPSPDSLIFTLALQTTLETRFNQILQPIRTSDDSLLAQSKAQHDKSKGRVAIFYGDPVERLYLSSMLHVLGYEVSDLQKTEQLRTMDLRKLPDLAIVHVEDGSVEGLNAVKVLRTIREKVELPILACTNAYDRELVSYLFDFGANDFIAKPIEQSQLTMRIENLMNQKLAFNESLKTELNLLQAQIKPHFLYNALSAVVSMCYTDAEAAAKTLIDLSRYLRLIFEASSSQLFVPLKQELDLIEAYVAVEKARFGHRLTFKMQASDGLMAYKIPFLLIQPFVENAIKHGICNRDEGGEVVLKIEEYGNYMVIKIIDDGMGIHPSLFAAVKVGEYKKGSGLRNVSKRLTLIKDSRLDIESDYQGTSVSITIPIRSDL